MSGLPSRGSPPGILGPPVAPTSFLAPPHNDPGDAREATGTASTRPPTPSETLAKDLRRLVVEEIYPDFEVVVQDEVITTHKCILVARSNYFASCILTSGMVESQAGRLVIPPDSAMTADAFRAFLRFLYAGDDILGGLAPNTAMYLVDASSFYGLANSRLKHFCEMCVRDSFNEAHVLQLFEASSRLNVDAVRSMALDFIILNFRTVCKRAGLEQLEKPLLIDILKGLAERMPLQQAGVASPAAPQENAFLAGGRAA